MVGQKRFDIVTSTYNELFKSVSRNIVTTNYDNVLETYCEQAGLDLVNGFEISRLGDRRTWGDAWEGGKNALYLTKLHGSITWQKDDYDPVLEIGRPGLRNANRDVMIAPTLGEKDYGDGIFPTLMDRFKTVLAETELLIVVGFSFRDPEINHMILNRLKRSNENLTPMKLLYVDPEPDGLKALIGPNAKIRRTKVLGKYVLWELSRDEMPYVYAYQDEFNRDTAELMRVLLDTVSKMDDKGQTHIRHHTYSVLR